MFATLGLFAAWAGFQPDSGLALKAFRAYRADPGQSPGQTQVTAFIRVPAELPAPGRNGEVSLTLAVRVVDGRGQALYEQSWQKRSVAPSPRGDADRLDLVRFTLGVGQYRLEVSAADSVSGRRLDAVLPIAAYAEPPAASDLLLSPWIRSVATADTVPQPGEFRRGGVILAIAPEVVVGGVTASLAYLFETYSGTALDGTLTVGVRNGGGAVIRQTAPAPVRVTAGIGLLTGQLEVGDLPPGDFRLIATLAVGGQTVERVASFRVDPEAASAPAALSDEAYFGMLYGLQLDQAFAPLAAIAPRSDLEGWPADSSDEAKRAFLTALWRKRDPTPRTPGNERRAQFYDGISYVNAFYAEPRRQRAGWQTDRGRVFLREGLPTQVLRRQERGVVPAYEVWRYFEKAGRYYLFVDRTGFGSYFLVRSNDPREPRERRWQEILTPSGVREVVAFLGREVLSP